MVNYIYLCETQKSYDRIAFQFTYYMMSYDTLKPYFQDVNQEAEWEDEQDTLLCLESFREGYRSRLREDPAVA